MDPNELAALDDGERIPLKKRAVRLAWCLVLIGVIVWTCPLGPANIPSTDRSLSPITIGGYEVGTWTDYGNGKLYSVSIGALPEIYIGNSLPSAIAGVERMCKGNI